MLTQIHVRWLLIYRILSEVCVMQEKKIPRLTAIHQLHLLFRIYYIIFVKKVFITSQFDVIVTNDFLFNVHLFFIETSSITYFELLSAECRYLEFVYQYILFLPFSSFSQFHQQLYKEHFQNYRVVSAAEKKFRILH